MKQGYEDLIRLPHPTSAVHPRMPEADRAAQFAPFAALSGYDAEIAESERQTAERATLSDSEMEEINGRLAKLQRDLPQRPLAEITFFRPDARKTGGAYVTVTGNVKKLDEYARTLTLADGTRICMDDIVAVETAAGEDAWTNS
jgi:hypothetical protein